MGHAKVCARLFERREETRLNKGPEGLFGRDKRLDQLDFNIDAASHSIAGRRFLLEI